MQYCLTTSFVLLIACPSPVTMDGLQFTSQHEQPYTIQGDYSTDIKVSVKANRKLCNTIPSGPGSIQALENDDLFPTLESVLVDGEIRINITWKASPTDDGRYPRIFVLYLDMYKYSEGKFTDVDVMCVQLKLGKRKASSNEISSTFFYDSLKPVTIPETYLLVQVWSLPDRIRNRSCRIPRAPLPNQHPCNFAAECSEQADGFHMSIDYHQYEYCECYHKTYDVPNMSWTQLENGTIKVNFSNFPPFSGDFVVKIMYEAREEIENVTIIGNTIHDGRVTFITKTQYGRGNYSISVYTRDPNSACVTTTNGYNERIKDTCFDLYPIIFSQNVIEINGAIISSSIHPLLGVLGGVAVAVSTIITIVVFVVYKKRGEKPSTAFESTITYNNRMKNSSQERRDYEKQKRVTGPDIENECLLKISGLQDIRGTGHYLTGTSDKITALHASPGHLKLAQKRKPKMLLCHIDDTNRAVIEDIKITLHGHGVQLHENIGSNWRDFAESAVETYSEIVMILSEELSKLCNDFNSRRPPDESLLERRQFQNIPCIVMEKLKTLLQDNPEREDFSLHLVLVRSEIENSQSLVNIFFQCHDVLRRTNNYYMYNFKDWNRPSVEQSEVFRVLLTNLTGRAPSIHDKVLY